VTVPGRIDEAAGQIAALLRRTAVANDALLNGDLNEYVRLITHASDYTLMAPFGGPTTRGFEPSSEHLAELARFFKSGSAELELVQSYASGELVVLVLIDGSMPRSVVCRIRTGHCASRRCIAARDPGGSSYIGMPTPWSKPSVWNRRRR